MMDLGMCGRYVVDMSWICHWICHWIQRIWGKNRCAFRRSSKHILPALSQYNSSRNIPQYVPIVPLYIPVFPIVDDIFPVATACPMIFPCPY